MIVGSTNSVKPPLFAMGNNISLDLSDNHLSSVLDFLNDDLNLNQSLCLAMLDHQVDGEGEMQDLITCINNICDLDEESAE